MPLGFNCYQLLADVNSRCTRKLWSGEKKKQETRRKQQPSIFTYGEVYLSKEGYPLLFLKPVHPVHWWVDANALSILVAWMENLTIRLKDISYFVSVPPPVVCYTAVFSVVTQRSWGGALREDTKNGCVADYTSGLLRLSATNFVAFYEGGCTKFSPGYVSL